MSSCSVVVWCFHIQYISPVTMGLPMFSDECLTLGSTQHRPVISNRGWSLRFRVTCGLMWQGPLSACKASKYMFTSDAWYFFSMLVSMCGSDQPGHICERGKDRRACLSCLLNKSSHSHIDDSERHRSLGKHLRGWHLYDAGIERDGQNCGVMPMCLAEGHKGIVCKSVYVCGYVSGAGSGKWQNGHTCIDNEYASYQVSLAMWKPKGECLTPSRDHISTANSGP